MLDISDRLRVPGIKEKVHESGLSCTDTSCRKDGDWNDGRRGGFS